MEQRHKAKNHFVEYIGSWKWVVNVQFEPLDVITLHLHLQNVCASGQTHRVNKVKQSEKCRFLVLMSNGCFTSMLQRFSGKHDKHTNTHTIQMHCRTHRQSNLNRKKIKCHLFTRFNFAHSIIQPLKHTENVKMTTELSVRFFFSRAVAINFEFVDFGVSEISPLRLTNSK